MKGLIKVNKKNLNYLNLIPLALLFPLLEILVFIMRFGIDKFDLSDSNIIQQSLTFVTIGVFSGILLIYLLNKTEEKKVKMSVIISYISFIPLSLYLSLIAGSFLSLIGVTIFGVIPLLIGTFMGYKVKNIKYIVIVVIIVIIIITTAMWKNLLKNDSINYQKSNVHNIEGKIKFDTLIVDGEKIDSSVLKEYKLTMINIWGTFSEPCISKLVDLENIYETLKAENINVNVIGVVTDINIDNLSKEKLALNKQNKDALNIINKKNVSFKNIVPDESLKKFMKKDIYGMPTTIFVDKYGNIIGETMVGSRSKENYMKEIKNILKTIK